MLTPAKGGAARRDASSALTRCPRPASPAFKHPHRSSNPGPGTEDREHFVQVRLSGRSPLKGAKEMLEEEARRPASPEHSFLDEKTHVRGLPDRRSRRLVGEIVDRRHPAAQSARSRGLVMPPRRWSPVGRWGSASEARRRHDPGSWSTWLLLGGHSAPGAGVARPRPLERAGRPHDGDLGAATEAFLDRLRDTFGFEPPRGTVGRRAAISVCSAARQVSSRWAATSSRPPPPRAHRPGARAHQTDRARRRAQPLAPDHRPRASPPCPRTDRGARRGGRTRWFRENSMGSRTPRTPPRARLSTLPSR